MNIFSNPTGKQRVFVYNKHANDSDIIQHTTNPNQPTIGNLFGAQPVIFFPLHLTKENAQKDILFNKEISVDQLGGGEITYDQEDLTHPLFYPGTVACHSYQERVLNKQLPPTSSSAAAAAPTSLIPESSVGSQDTQEPARKKQKKRKVTKEQSYSLLGY